MVLLREITYWSLLRVKGFNDHSVFFFFSVFQKLSHEAHAGSLQFIINTSGYLIVKILRVLGQHLTYLGSTYVRKESAKEKQKQLMTSSFHIPPPPPSPPSASFPRLEYSPLESSMVITYLSGLSITDKLIFDIMLSYTSVDE